MDTSVYIFSILLDIFIAFTIFAIYLYILFRYFIHRFEELGLLKIFKTHLEFYSPLFTLYKNSDYGVNNPEYVPNILQKEIDNITHQIDSTSYTIANYSILGFILGQFLILIIYFLIFKNKIMAQMHMMHVLLAIGVNIGFILMFELLFLFFIYGNTDLLNISEILDFSKITPEDRTKIETNN